ncbi:MAG TPA: type II secretion system protein [Tepidisphaeraceae bacterium]|nr:type II secretion system protein [Tepidisphaeraceae bacterium]
MMQTRRRRDGFTLIELLTVIGIIVILVSILLPVVSAVRKRAYQTSSAAMISRISTAIQAYFADFQAYPGPVPDNMISPNPTTGITGITGSLTSSENLVLGLLGGLTPTPSTPGSVTYLPQQILDRRGPSSLNANSPRQYASYINVQNNELSPFDTGKKDFTPYSSLATNVVLTDLSPPKTFPKPTVADTTVPEFYDHFPSPRPIIYLRARVGTPFMYLGSPAGGTKAKLDYQYDPGQLTPYWIGGTPGSLFPTIPDVDQNAGVAVYQTPFDFFKHPTINDSPNSNPLLARTPRGKDAYILISAGADGIYGTKDDIIYSN